MKLHHYNEMVAYLTRPRQKYENGGPVIPEPKPEEAIHARKLKDFEAKVNLGVQGIRGGMEKDLIIQMLEEQKNLIGLSNEDARMVISNFMGRLNRGLKADGGRIKAADGLAVQTLNPAFPTKDPTDTESFKPLDLPGAIIPPLAIGVGAKRLKDIFFSEPNGKDEKIKVDEESGKTYEEGSEIDKSIELEKKAKELAETMSDTEIELRGEYPTASDEEIKEMLEKIERDKKVPNQKPPKLFEDKIEKFLLKEAVDRLKQKEMDKTKRDDRTILARDLELDVPKSGLYELRKKENENFFQNRLQTLKDKGVNFDGYYSTREIANLLGIKTNSGIEDFIKRKNVPSVKQQGLYKVVKLNDFLNAYQPTKERIQAASELDARTKARSNFISEAAKGGFYDRFKKLRQPKFLPTEVKEVYDKYNLSEIEGGHPFPIEFFTKKYGKGNILQDERQFDWIHRNKDKLFDKNDLVFQSKDVNTLYRNKISKLKNLYKELGPLVDKYEGKGPVTNEKDINKIANLNLKIMKIATDSEGDAKKFIEKSPNSRDLSRMSKGGLHGAIFDYETGEVSLYAPGKEAGFVKGSVGEIETEKGVVPGEKLKLAGDYLDIINQVITDQGDKKLFTDFIQQELLPRFQKGGPVYGKYAKQIAGIS